MSTMRPATVRRACVRGWGGLESWRPAAIVRRFGGTVNVRQLSEIGVPMGAAMEAAFAFISRFCREGGIAPGLDNADKHAILLAEIRAVVGNPGAYFGDAWRGPLAQALLEAGQQAVREPVAFRQWGDEIQAEAVDQMRKACALPVSVAGALMPDAHVGYGLPIGGVLATANAVIPYAVGVDIACRMKLSVLDWPVEALRGRGDILRAALEGETRFGVGVGFDSPHQHPVLDEDWRVSPVTQRHRERARKQLGTSGSGNHFVEFGELTVSVPLPGGLPVGRYLALLSHSGSRGTGAAVCDHYSKLAMQRQSRSLPEAFKRLAWLELDSAEGQEYWAAMELMGLYAAANHAIIHASVTRRLGAEIVYGVENHHNFAWKESHGGREVVVHRKGATPAGAGVLGVIPGSMATPGFVVRGRGVAASLNSAAHGAGRCMSRTAAAKTFDWSQANALLAERGVTLLSAGIDEVPMVYKDIHAVMAAQADLVETLARFDPRLVKMCPAGERPED